jgi:uncharacterized membrane protein YgcG
VWTHTKAHTRALTGACTVLPRARVRSKLTATARHHACLSCTQSIVATDGVAGLFTRGLTTRIAANGLQNICFTVLWSLVRGGAAAAVCRQAQVCFRSVRACVPHSFWQSHPCRATPCSKPLRSCLCGDSCQGQERLSHSPLMARWQPAAPAGARAPSSSSSSSSSGGGGRSSGGSDSSGASA